MNLDDLADQLRHRFDEKSAARERALPAARRAIRSSANAIRAIHRGERDGAARLMAEARAALDEGIGAVGEHPDVRYAGHLQDAEKEYAEARITDAVIFGGPVPEPDEIRVDIAPYVNGLAEAIGECRRHILDLLRTGQVDRSEAVLSAMDEMYYLLVTMDYPDAITGNLRRSTDIARSIIEKTRGDLSVAIVSRDLHDALSRHAKDALSGE